MMGPRGRLALLRTGTAATILAAAISLSNAPQAEACVLGTPLDWTFKHGVSVAFVGRVVAVRDDPDLVFPRVEVVLDVEDVVVGQPSERVTIGPAGSYCQTLLYEIGDTLVVAGGAPADGSFVYDEFGPGPPYNKYNVAVWGPFNRPVDDIGPTLGGEPVGDDLAELIAMLDALPDTALADSGSTVIAMGLVLLVAAVAITTAAMASRGSTRDRGGRA